MIGRFGWDAVGAAAAMLIVFTGCSAVDCPSGFAARMGMCVLAASPGSDGGPSGTADGAVAGSGGSENGGAGASANGGGQSGAFAGSGADGSAAGGGAGGSAGSSGASGPSAGDASGAAGSDGTVSPGDPCTTEGMQRCAITGPGAKETCAQGIWTAVDGCPAGQTCLMDATGAPSCVTVAELCRGSGGQTLCDPQGSLVVCKADESIEMMMSCKSARHCRVGIPAKTCATCLPEEERRCTGKLLEQCSPDGMSFSKLDECETEGLCNKMVGKCTDAVCDPSTTVCDGNSLVACNAQGTAVAKTTPCASGSTCDPMGLDCNKCQPGEKTCQGDMAATCDPTGQNFMPMSCPSSTPKCIGQGNCVECSSSADCSKLNQGCKVGACMGNRCMAADAPAKTACTASNGKPGTCSGGMCICTPQCSGKECGDNGCGGQCNTCPSGKNCTSGFKCVTCTSNSQCTSGLSECQRGSCSPTGDCVVESVADGTSCEGDRHCKGGKCADCTSPSHCTSGLNECQRGSCSSSGDCQVDNVPDGTSCRGGDGHCRGGKCADCTSPSHCTAGLSDCQRGSCSSIGECQVENVSDGTTCGGGSGRCKGGRCGDCTTDSHCTSGLGVCESGTCSSNGDCEIKDAPNGTQCMGSGRCENGSCCTEQCGDRCSGTVCGRNCTPSNCINGTECMGSGRCETPPPPTRSITRCDWTVENPNAPCRTDEFCSTANYCANYCDNSGNCGSGFMCIDGITCVIPPPCKNPLVERRAWQQTGPIVCAFPGTLFPVMEI